MENVVITGYGIACPLGVGREQVWSSIEQRRSGVRVYERMAGTDWPIPFGGIIRDEDFDPKEWVKPRKSLKVMAREIQLAFAAGEQAWDHAALEDATVDPERMGVVFGAGLMYCPPEELEASYQACLSEDGRFDYESWGPVGMRELFPLWMLKYLPNMSACHTGIRRDARGPTNTIAHGDASSLMALSEAASMIQRGATDVMFVGASSSRLNQLDPLWREGAAAWKAGVDPAEACRPFDRARTGAVCGEGAGVIVLENQRHAQRRGANIIARVASVAVRNEGRPPKSVKQGRAIVNAVNAALEQAGVTPDELAFVSAHACGSVEQDEVEAAALRATIGDAPVTAPKSFFGNTGASGGSVEMAVTLSAIEHGAIPPTLNYETPDPNCPVNVAAEQTPFDKPAVLKLNYNLMGQAVATVLVVE
ncbi:Actinorhodin polyketide putative beta-ketoacyl synthase 1 [Posidoniimonas polymericola]|uniref:Actinorhodin polyketide putative beta-ketoacyl synthase 1 n=1 Tax=Posidoniimonas polymericola TaxID=2528002 RepID=A0A5C5YG47_9BACT|nr:beta-ketoacyl-[acyl-carrier-protein] synthase family protein [Posidoniimonas polymericola]TWT73843.1 Actinorhodin polyketide putative beta-ketoacyl synthase 1 [Posidoniimonas polymericola]